MSGIGKEFDEADLIAREFVREIFCMADDPQDDQQACRLKKDHSGDCEFGLKPWLANDIDVARHTRNFHALPEHEKDLIADVLADHLGREPDR